tara:strand:- start:12262 stop:13293 length:1032 start_codon:yes stop_codon:yes gene_type:complete
MEMMMTDKLKKIEEKFFSELNQYETFEDKHDYIQAHPYKDRIFELSPDLKTKVDAFMITNIMSEHGDTLSNQFNFSKDMSNSEILRNITLQDANKEYIENFSFQISPELGEQIKGLEFIDSSDKNNPVTYKYSDFMEDNNAWMEDIPPSKRHMYRRKAEGYTVKGTAAFRALGDLKHSEFEPIESQKKSYTDNIRTLRQEFDDRVGHLSALSPSNLIENKGFPMIIPGLNTVSKAIMQLMGGWADIGQDEGLEKVENRLLTYDTENKRFGPGPEIGREQSKLKAVYRDEEDLKDKWAGYDTKYDELKESLDTAIERETKLQKTAIDEALNYTDIETLKGLLNE